VQHYIDPPDLGQFVTIKPDGRTHNRVEWQMPPDLPLERAALLHDHLVALCRKSRRGKWQVGDGGGYIEDLLPFFATCSALEIRDLLAQG